ncbi:hypothetical protein TEQG_03451 [Trichophyton equinum CBS 127.97]|uniref:Uncharacterized protein n=1 Tax=Trichophyton equinum (strain ATCC MYA-4606 / CBS 127.97) TaxID=559882 RepID=F2PRR2_TRIEC|nr:hypothetical protein TEQG_03451 [Trichophyton equinum CBS 127.97]
MLVEVGCSSLTKLSRSEVASRDLRNQPSEPSPLHTELLPFFQFLTIEKLHVATLKISKDATVHETPSRCLARSPSAPSRSLPKPRSRTDLSHSGFG